MSEYHPTTTCNVCQGVIYNDDSNCTFGAGCYGCNQEICEECMETSLEMESGEWVCKICLEKLTTFFVNNCK